MIFYSRTVCQALMWMYSRGGLVKMRFDIVSLRWGLRFYFSHKLSGDVMLLVHSPHWEQPGCGAMVTKFQALIGFHQPATKRVQ